MEPSCTTALHGAVPRRVDSVIMHRFNGSIGGSTGGSRIFFRAGVTLGTRASEANEPVA